MFGNVKKYIYLCSEKKNKKHKIMGCHTWAYKIATQEEIDKAKKELIDASNRFLVETKASYMKDIYESPLCKTKKDRKEWNEWYDNRKKFHIRISKGEISNKDVVEELSIFKMHNGNIYVECGFDQPFRLYGYPEETFTDKAELLDFLKKNEKLVGYYDKTNDYNFVKGYTIELVNAVNEYFEKYGENNLYFEFG